jgi:predicted HicB family RNase H-like nuclease
VTKKGRPFTVPGGLTVNVNVRLPAKLARDLRRRARFAGKSVAAYVRAVLENCKDMGPW